MRLTSGLAICTTMIALFSACTIQSPMVAEPEGEPAFTQQPMPAVVQFEKPVSFTTPDGSPVVVPNGSYMVTAGGQSALSLTPLTDGPSLTIAATPSPQTYLVDQSEPVAIALAGEQEDRHHILLAQTDGTSLEAVGSYSGVHTRALTFIPKSQAQQELQNKLAASAQTAPPLYRIVGNGDLLQITPPTFAKLSKVGNGWQGFTQVVAGAENSLYALQPNGTLLWYQHQGAPLAAMRWLGPKPVRTSWQHFSTIMAGHDGVLYGITKTGDLLWFRHLAPEAGEDKWEGPIKIGNGWQSFEQVFSGCQGILYAVTKEGKLLWYRHHENVTTPSWQGPKEVGTGWGGLRAVTAGCDGRIYAVKPDGQLLEFEHRGRDRGTGLETPGSWVGPKSVASGWTDSKFLIAARQSSQTVTIDEQSSSIVSWDYLRMNQPGVVAETIRAVQNKERSPDTLTGLASPEMIAEMLAVPAASSPGSAGMKSSAPGAGPLGTVQDADLQGNPSSVRNAPKSPASGAIGKIGDFDPTVHALPHFDVFPKQAYLGKASNGQLLKGKIRVIAPEAGVVTAALTPGPSAFRLMEARGLTGLLIPTEVFPKTVVLKDTKGPIAVVPPFRIDAKAGQAIEYEVRFEPTLDVFGNSGTPVGTYTVKLEIRSTAGWYASVPVTAEFTGVAVGVIGFVDENDVRVFYDGTPCNRPMAFPLSMTFINGSSQTHTVTVKPGSLAPSMTIDPFTVTLTPGERRQAPLRATIDGCTPGNEPHQGSLIYSYSGTTREVPFSATIFKTSREVLASGWAGSCRFTLDASLSTHGSIYWHYGFRNYHPVQNASFAVELVLQERRYPSGVISAAGIAANGDWEYKEYRMLHDSLRQNYKLLTDPIRIVSRCRLL